MAPLSLIKGPFLIASRVSPLAMHTSSCMLLMLFGLTRVSPHRRRVHAACGGGKNSWKCMRDAFPPPVSISRGADRRRSRASRTSGTSTAIIEAIRPERAGAARLFSAKGWVRYSRAPSSRFFVGKVARRRHSRRWNWSPLPHPSELCFLCFGSM